MNQPTDPFNLAAQDVVDLANRITEADPEADPWDVADGLLAGAIHYWLFSRQPCGDPRCEDCEPVSTAEHRMVELQRWVRQFAEDSEYYHAPTDANVGRA
ncbi:MAG: hypothetical protein HUJ28_07930 [Chromatiales bacterium]|nr:hypothetical protein [Chromatiales bacterium]